MKNAAYWGKRFSILEEARNKAAESVNAEIGIQFELAQRSIDDQIRGWYGRFAKNNEISLAEAKEWLIGKDLAEFKWDVNEYIRHGKNVGADPAFIKQLENASARFHISKLEALKLKTQSTLENLHGNTQSSISSVFGQIYKDNYYHTAYELQKGFGIGWDIAALNQGQIESVLSKPWTLDEQTFSDRIWTQKQSLLNEVHTQLTQNMILGKAPDDAIKAIAKKFDTSKYNAGRLVMTESAYFANEAQETAFAELDVEEYEIVETLDSTTCPICGALDGKVFKMSDYQAGVTAPPFHPWCRGCTAPHFSDNDDGGKRAARGRSEKTYYVPANTKYTDWKDKFVNGGDKSGLVPIDSGGVVSDAKNGLLNGNKYVTIKKGNLEQSLGKVHTDKIVEILNEAPDNVKSVWNKYADQLAVITTQSKRGNFCNRHGISIDLDTVSREMMYKGQLAKKPYYAVYHEFGHNIDNIVRNERGEYRSIADTFRSTVHTNLNGSGRTLTEMLEHEGTQRINDIWTRLKKDVKAAGGKASEVSKFKAYQELTAELRAKPVLSMTDVSDMWDGITKEKVRPHFGHGKSYWKDHTVGGEGFAEMFSATTMNPDSVAEIKHYFPKSYEIFEEILESIGGIE